VLNPTIDLYGGCGNSATSRRSSSRAGPGSRKVTSRTAGFRIERVTYFVSVLLPMLVGVAVLEPRRGAGLRPDCGAEERGVMNWFLERCLLLE